MVGALPTTSGRQACPHLDRYCRERPRCCRSGPVLVLVLSACAFGWVKRFSFPSGSLQSNCLAQHRKDKEDPEATDRSGGRRNARLDGMKGWAKALRPTLQYHSSEAQGSRLISQPQMDTDGHRYERLSFPSGSLQGNGLALDKKVRRTLRPRNARRAVGRPTTRAERLRRLRSPRRDPREVKPVARRRRSALAQEPHGSRPGTEKP